MVFDGHYHASLKSKPIYGFWAQSGEHRSILRSKSKLFLLPLSIIVGKGNFFFLVKSLFRGTRLQKPNIEHVLDDVDDMRLQLTSVTQDIAKHSHQ